ncbi:MAG: hypothetical protein ACYC7G_01525 [Rudaea sp.]
MPNLVTRDATRHLEVELMQARKLIALLIIAAAETRATGQSSGGAFRIDSATLTPGGTLAGGAFSLHGNFGQPLAGPSSGGAYALNAGAIGTADSIFHNGFETQ